MLKSTTVRAFLRFNPEQCGTTSPFRPEKDNLKIKTGPRRRKGTWKKEQT
jgi:hypothetical protein